MVPPDAEEAAGGLTSTRKASPILAANRVGEMMLDNLRPKEKRHVYDLVKATGFDMSDWENFEGRSGVKTNPKYCYEWAHLQEDKLAILNLWHGDLVDSEGRIVHRGNYRKEAQAHRDYGGRGVWARRAERLDNAIKIALRNNLPIRVIVLDVLPREQASNPRASKVGFRDLDPTPWSISAYNDATGEFELTRGILNHVYVDQFDVDQEEKSSSRKEVLASIIIRDPSVRRMALERAKGTCQFCGQQGFRMANGALYLETHHVIPLSENGRDHISNVVAICADDHRRAHYADNRDEISERLKAIARSGLA